MTINHLGMRKILQTMILSAQEAGASAIKLKLKNVNKYYKDDNKKWRNFNFKNYRGSLELCHEDFIEIDRFCRKINIPWFISGGINETNVKNIQNLLNPNGIDLSSGVEVSKGIKSNKKINNLFKKFYDN